MKCAKCGAELKEGCLYCSVCGHEAQIVNGYSALEEDYLKSILAEEAKKDAVRNTEVGENKGNTSELSKKKTTKAKKKNNNLPIILVIVLLAVALIAGIALKVYFDYKNSNSYDYQIEMAEEQQLDHNYETALSYYAAALALMPNDISARIKMADIYIVQGETDSAMVLLIEVIDMDSNNIDAYRMLISLYEKNGEYDKIVELAKEVSDASVLELFEDYLVDVPSFTLADGTYENYMNVMIESDAQNDIYYTLDGSDPSENGILYDEDGIELNEPGLYRIMAVACNKKGIYSDIVEAKYTIKIQAPSSPKVTPDGGTFHELTTVTITAAEGCKIYYTWDGTNPTALSEEYIAPIEIPIGNNILSVIVIDEQSGLSSKIYRTNFIYGP